jgi:hypothetical protein
MTVANLLAYYDAATITVVKSFVAQALILQISYSRDFAVSQ